MPELDEQVNLDDWVFKIFHSSNKIICGLGNGCLNIYEKNKKESI